MSLTMLYLLFVVLPNAGATLSHLATTLITMFFFSCLVAALMGTADPSAWKYSLRIAKWSGIVGICLALLTIALPSEKQLYYIAGGYAATNSEELKKLPDNVLKAANAWLEKETQAVEKVKK